MNPYGMDDEQFLDCLGPDWSTMSTAERQAYPHAASALVLVHDEPVRALNPRQMAARARRAS